MCNSLFVLIAGKLKVRRTKPDPCENKNDAVPPAYQNHVTHWWDGSQSVSYTHLTLPTSDLV